ncbi:hypothetical protein LCGC14_0736640 [marine sediment metagenome]|uniref:Uncharacterized protein n=1 Tax=marine sediment metagenome TaxID=412755 RepID=A0A0F9SSV8_9ZZZZ|nr:hypothetical protein [archaeon]HEC38072.1 hypothetical protein [bacterium]
MQKRKVTLLLCLSVLFFCAFIFPVQAVPIETYGWEYYNSPKYEDKIKFQTDAVYIDTTQGGVTPYGIWVYGRNDFNGGSRYSTRVHITFYLTAKFEKTSIIPSRPPITYWGPTPDGLIKWQGEYSYNPSSSNWQWTVGVQEKYFSFSAQYTPSAYSSWGTANSISGDYRYLGYFLSTMAGQDHEFHSLLKLHIVNEEAREWASGKTFYDGQEWWIEKIVDIRVKMMVYFRWEFWGWRTLKTVTHVLGDGAVLPSPGGGTDLYFIPLVEGTAG